MRGFLDILERAVFRHRLFAIISFALITCFLLFKATQIQKHSKHCLNKIKPYVNQLVNNCKKP